MAEAIFFGGESIVKRGTFEIVEQSLFYIIIFLILREWLVPILMLTDTGYFNLFLMFMALCLVIGLAKLPFIVSWIIKAAYILWVIVGVYNDGSISNREFLATDLRYNFAVIFSGDWILVSDPLRTSLFFILIWMLIYLIQHWVSVRLTIYYFLVLTVFFVATLDTFTAYDGSAAIVKIMILGLVMTSLLFIKRLMQSTNMQKDWTSYLTFATPIIVLVTAAGLVASFLPKAEPQWPDPVPYLKGAVGIGGSDGAVSKVGYGDDDSSLGGPFTGDDTIVYEIKTPIRQYWRVETKDQYTSKGWERTAEEQPEYILLQSDTIPLSMTLSDEEPRTVQIHSLEAKHLFLLQTYGTTSYNLNNPYEQLNFNPTTEKLVAMTEGSAVHPGDYSLTYREPVYSYTELKETTTSTEQENRYLQLPESLPQRVRDLAVEITDEAESVYDKARAVESYFRRSGFRYETTNVAKPKEGQDYVDQFLFETQVGYCDNFSTSMVVLLRSVGIEARWVKGFSSGERVGSQDGIHTYEVSNNDAHSWVEAYIDGIGWMPFEPTIGFSNPVNIDYDIKSNADDFEQLPEREKQELQEREEREQQQQKTKAAGKTIDLSKWKWLFYILGTVLVVAGIVLWKKRGKWQPKLVVQMNRSKLNNETTFEDGYFVLLKQLERIHLKRSQDETLQHFAKRVDQQLKTTKMRELTSVYEEIIYAGSSRNFDTVEMKEIWEYLINRTIS